MFERFTATARAAVVQTQEEARTLGHTAITSGHLLIALARDGASARALAAVGFDAEAAVRDLERSLDPAALPLTDDEAAALRTLGVDVDEVRRAIAGSFAGGGPPPEPGAARPSRGHLTFTADAKRALEHSLREAIRLRDRRIGCEHVLLGAVGDGGSTAGALLELQGIGPDAVREAVERERAAGAPRRTA